MFQSFKHDLTEYVRFLEGRLPEYGVGDGLYQRHIMRTGHDTEGRADAYGTADAVNIMYTLGRLPEDPAGRKALADGIRSFQEADTSKTACCCTSRPRAPRHRTFLVSVTRQAKQAWQPSVTRPWQKSGPTAFA